MVMPQAEAFDEGCLDATRQTLRSQSLAIFIGRPEAHVLTNFCQASAAIAFQDLGIQQSGFDHPTMSVVVYLPHPLSEVGRQCVEIEGQAIAREDGQAAGCEPLREFMNQLMSQRLGTWA